MHPNIIALRRTLESLKVPFTEIPGFRDALIVSGRSFVRAATPFNHESVAALCLDKDAVHKILSGKVRMPKTRGFLDPFGRYPELCTAKSIDEIVGQSLDFLYPRIVKMNQGERGRNVFLVKDEREMRDALSAIFDKSSRGYDYLALVQEYIEPKNEYRVAVADGIAALAYDRKQYKVPDKAVADELAKLATTAAQILNLSWGSIDFIESNSDELYLIEANTKPGFEGFIDANGDGAVQELYKKALRNFS